VKEKETNYSIEGERAIEIKTPSQESTFCLRKSIDRAHKPSTPPCISPILPKKRKEKRSLDILLLNKNPKLQ
jgi:hypothetical protein